jgi:hypothetical protein
MEEDELDEHAARRSGTYSCALNAGGMALEWVIERKVGGIPWWPGLVSALVGIGVMLVLVAYRHQPARRLGTAAFLGNAAAVVFALWMTHPYYAAVPRPWRPFEANKLGAMTAALLATNRWAGLVAIAGYIGSAVLQYQLFPGNAQERLSVTEPWASVAYGAFSVGLLAYRLRGLRMAKELIRERAEAVVLQRLAKASLSLRDLANTSLQTLELSMALLRARERSLIPILARMERALQRLRALGRALSRYETPALRSSDLLSIDSDPTFREARVDVASPRDRPRS